MSADRELLKGNTPTLILAVLKAGPLHGYAIAREIERQSGDVLRFKEGTLYPALHRLEREGLVVAEWQVQTNGPARKIYRLTSSGRTALEKRVRAWNEFTQAVSQIIGGVAHGGKTKQETA